VKCTANSALVLHYSQVGRRIRGDILDSPRAAYGERIVSTAKIGGMLFERTALSRKPEEMIKQELAKLWEGDTLTPDLAFRDPYFLSFLIVPDRCRRRRDARPERVPCELIVIATSYLASMLFVPRDLWPSTSQFY
jgi:hypothetical protein